MRFAAPMLALALMWGAGSVDAGELFEGLGPRLIGSQLTDVLEGAELACKQDGNEASVRRCQPLPGALDTLGGANITSAEAMFVDKELELVTVYFSDRDFAKVSAYLTQQLGGGQDWSVTLRGGMNMGFKDQIFIWERDDLHAVGVEPAERPQRHAVLDDQPWQLVDPPEQGQGERLERHHEGGDDCRENEALPAPAHPRQGEGRHAVDEDPEGGQGNSG